MATKVKGTPSQRTLMLQISKKKDTALVGLEIEAGSVAAVEIRTNGASQLSATAIGQLPAGCFHDGEVTDSGAVSEVLRSLFSKHKLSRRVRIGIANQRVVVRTLRLPAIDDPKELEAAVRFEAQEQIPMPIDQAVLDHRVIGGIPASEESAPQIDVMVVAARRDMIEATLKPLRDAGLQPVGVDLSAFGLIRALGQPAPIQSPATPEEGPIASPRTILFCNVGDVTNLAIAKGRSCIFTRVSPAGLEGIATGLVASTGLSGEHARMWMSHVGLSEPIESIEGDPETVSRVREALDQGASTLLDELRLSLDFYAAQETAEPIDQIVLAGPGSAIGGLPERMEPILALPISVGRPDALGGLDQTAAARLTLPYGLAMDS